MPGHAASLRKRDEARIEARPDGAKSSRSRANNSAREAFSCWHRADFSADQAKCPTVEALSLGDRARSGIDEARCSDGRARRCIVRAKCSNARASRSIGRAFCSDDGAWRNKPRPLPHPAPPARLVHRRQPPVAQKNAARRRHTHSIPRAGAPIAAPHAGGAAGSRRVRTQRADISLRSPSRPWFLPATLSSP